MTNIACYCSNAFENKAVFHRQMNQTTGHRFIWNSAAALQAMVGCANANDASSNKWAYSGLGDREVQRFIEESRTKTDSRLCECGG